MRRFTDVMNAMENLPSTTVWLLSSIMESRGKMESTENIDKSELIRQAILRQPDGFTLADIQAACPSASGQLVKKVLARLKSDGKASLAGRGRGAQWRATGIHG